MPEFEYFPEVYDLSDFSEASDLSLTNDEFRTVERLDAPKGEAVAPGQGQDASPEGARGRIYIDAQNSTPANIDGTIRLVVLNSQNRVVKVVYQNKASVLRDGSSDRTKRAPFTFRGVDIREPYKFAIQMKTESGTDTWSSADSAAEIDGFRGEAVN